MLNAWETIVFNFACFPIRTAILFPIHIYGELNFVNNGTINIIGDIRNGMIRINPLQKRKHGVTKIENYGTICFHQGIRIMGGANIAVLNNAVLSIGEHCTIGEDVVIMVNKSVTIGKRTDIAFGCVLQDTNSHFVYNFEDKRLSPMCSNVEIGNFNWICNNTSIKAGVKTPDNLIVAASYSVLTKDYTNFIAPLFNYRWYTS